MGKTPFNDPDLSIYYFYLSLTLLFLLMTIASLIYFIVLTIRVYREFKKRAEEESLLQEELLQGDSDSVQIQDFENGGSLRSK